MALIVPKIVYNSITLSFTYPPVQKPGADDLEVTRHDTFSISGLKQTVLERVDVFKNLQMDSVPIADMPLWAAFMVYALSGGEFDYYSDSTLGGFTTFTLEDQAWAPTYSMGRGSQVIAKFKLRLRKVRGSDQTGS